VAIHYEHAGFNPDGSPHFNITSDDPNAHIVLTGPITGQVVVDGQAVDVSAPFIEAKDEAHALAISDAIGLYHVEHGHPDFVNDHSIDPETGREVDDFGFVHVGSDGVPMINAAAHPDTIAKVEAAVEAHPDLETGSLVKVEV